MRTKLDNEIARDITNEMKRALLLSFWVSDKKKMKEKLATIAKIAPAILLDLRQNLLQDEIPKFPQLMSSG